MTAPHADQIIAGYLARLEAALASLAPGRREELLEDVRAHIAEARGTLSNETDADILNIVDRLGDPTETAAEESGRSSDPQPARVQGGQPLKEIAAIVLLLVFWPAGVILLWLSDLWSTRDKVIGTLVPPGGYLAAIIVVPVLALGALGPVCRSFTGTDSLGNITSGTTCPQGLAGADRHRRGSRPGPVHRRPDLHDGIPRVPAAPYEGTGGSRCPVYTHRVSAIEKVRLTQWSHGAG